LLILPFAILLGENNVKLWKKPSQSKANSGPIARLVWSLGAIIQVAAFSSVLKSVLVKNKELKTLEKNNEIIDSQIPVILSFESEIAFQAYKASPFYLDRWLYDNADHVFFWNRYFSSFIFKRFF